MGNGGRRKCARKWREKEQKRTMIILYVVRPVMAASSKIVRVSFWNALLVIRSAASGFLITQPPPSITEQRRNFDLDRNSHVCHITGLSFPFPNIPRLSSFLLPRYLCIIFRAPTTMTNFQFKTQLFKFIYVSEKQWWRFLLELR